MPSNADRTGAVLERAAAAVRDAVAALPAPPVGRAAIVLIDGRSGSGKTTLAARLREQWRGPVQVIALDDLYPGWDGLAAGAAFARERILKPLVAGEVARWNRWDWARSERGDEVETRPDVPVIVEGSGLLTPSSAALAPVRVWLDAPEPVRRTRALARDGETYRPHWDRWAAQEERHLSANAPRELATLVVDVP